MSRKKSPKEKKPPDLPTNPEFQAFVGTLRGIMAVPKSEIDRMLAEERAAREQVRGVEDATDAAWDFGLYLADIEKRVASGELTGEDPFPEDCVDMSHIDDEAGQTEDDGPLDYTNP